MKKYNYMLECFGNGVRTTHYLTSKTLKGLEKQRQRFCERHKVTTINWCLFEFVGNNNSKYCKDSYKTIEQFNVKPFYEYWS